MSNLLEQIEQSIRSRRLLRRGQSVLVAVSGGLDSMVLLHLLHELSKKYAWRLTVAHLNHQLRGRSSDADERLVWRAAKKLGLPLVSRRARVRDFARAHKLSLEMAGRKLRHEFLGREALRLKIPVIALAHHADDQVELFFLRLLRGSGGEGLAGMKWLGRSPSHPRVRLARPLLNQPKSALRDYGHEKNISFREDATNTLVEFQRNRIRHELLPLLRKEYQPALDKTVSRMMEIIAGESECVTQSAERWLRKKEARDFTALPVAVQRRCLQLQLLAHGIVPDFDLVERLRLSANRAFAVNPRTTVCRNDAGRVKSRDVEAAGFKTERLEIDLDGRAAELVFGNVKLRWQFRVGKTPTPPRAVTGSEYFDADKVGTPITLRHWQPGDRFQPIGMPSPVKLQDLFTNQKIPRPLRRQLIVATTGAGEVFWVERLRLGECFKLTAATVRRLKWTWQRL